MYWYAQVGIAARRQVSQDSTPGSSGVRQPCKNWVSCLLTPEVQSCFHCTVGPMSMCVRMCQLPPSNCTTYCDCLWGSPTQLWIPFSHKFLLRLMACLYAFVCIFMYTSSSLLCVIWNLSPFASSLMHLYFLHLPSPPPFHPPSPPLTLSFSSLSPSPALPLPFPLLPLPLL